VVASKIRKEFFFLTSGKNRVTTKKNCSSLLGNRGGCIELYLGQFILFDIEKGGYPKGVKVQTDINGFPDAMGGYLSPEVVNN